MKEHQGLAIQKNGYNGTAENWQANSQCFPGLMNGYGMIVIQADVVQVKHLEIKVDAKK